MYRSLTASAVAALLSLGLAAQASAATVIGATSITITSAGPVSGQEYIQVSELVARDFSNVDVALATNGGSAVGSSDWPGSGAGYAIDGVAPNAFNQIFHSLGTGSGEYLTVSFAPTTLSSLSVYGRTDCCSNRDVFNYSIFAGQTLLTSGQLDARGAGHVGTVSFDAPQTGAVPEPASWALMILGFGGVGYSMRRRSAKMSFAAA